MKTGILCRFALLCCVVLSGGCSLLKVSVSEGDPLPRAEVRMRVMTRGFYHDLTAAVARTADSIADAAPDLQTRIGAVRWKMQVSSAAVGAAMQPIPEVALADTWILCRRMEEAFAVAQALEEVQAALCPKWEGRFRAAVAGEAWLDFTLADKGTGLEQLCAALGVALEEVAAFGDNFNDVPMLRRAGRSWLMAGAAAELRAEFPSQCQRVEAVLCQL